MLRLLTLEKRIGIRVHIDAVVSDHHTVLPTGVPDEPRMRRRMDVAGTHALAHFVIRHRCDAAFLWGTIGEERRNPRRCKRRRQFLSAHGRHAAIDFLARDHARADHVFD
jgi:hypothetical protein